MTDAITHGRVLGDWLTEEARLDPDREFLQCASPWMTLAELDRASDIVARKRRDLSGNTNYWNGLK